MSSTSSQRDARACVPYFLLPRVRLLFLAWVAFCSHHCLLLNAKITQHALSFRCVFTEKKVSESSGLSW